MAEFLMPTLGADMDAGILVAWKKQPGESIRRGEIIAEVETEKAAVDVESLHTGVVERLLVQPGEKVAVGTVLAIIREEGRPAAPPAGPAAVTVASQPAPPGAALRPAVSPSPTAPDAGRLRISPAARQLAQQLRVEPTSVKGTGPGGAITRDDIERAAKRPPTEEAPASRQERMRQTIAAAMSRSKREIPHYYLSTTIDMGTALKWLAAENEKRSVPDRLLYGVLLIKAVALALREVPELSGFWKDGLPAPSPAIHVGVAISLRQGGLVAPALQDTDRRTLNDLMAAFRDLVKRARAWTLRSSELSDPTITVTSLGEQGVDSVFGVIYPPQVALVGFGKVVERPWVVQGRVEPRAVMTATLSADHRVSDGHRGGLFLAAIDRLLQHPEDL
jgi:pyruvate dehydrogenase E2 component (dihydrolipoamide acetyltransferase)